MTSSSTKQWLRDNTVTYVNKERIYQDVLYVLDTYPGLRPKTDIYTFNDGRTLLLLCLHGLLPITFKSIQYNIPIAIWCPTDYPRSPPLAYVVPTHDMLIRQSQLVQLDGSLELPYLDNWRQKPEGCSLTPLIESMQDLFSHQPPLYAKPKQPVPPPAREPSITNSNNANNTQNANPPTLPPKPTRLAAPSSHSTSSPPPSSVLTQQLPYPQQGQHQPNPSSFTSEPTSEIPNPSFSEHAHTPPPFDPISNPHSSTNDNDYPAIGRQPISSRNRYESPPPHQTRPDSPLKQQRYHATQPYRYPNQSSHDRLSPRVFSSSVSSFTAPSSVPPIVLSPSPYHEVAQQGQLQQQSSPTKAHGASHLRSQSHPHPQWHPGQSPIPLVAQDSVAAINRVGSVSGHQQYTHPTQSTRPLTVPELTGHGEERLSFPQYSYHHQPPRPGSHGLTPAPPPPAVLPLQADSQAPINNPSIPGQYTGPAVSGQGHYVPDAHAHGTQRISPPVHSSPSSQGLVKPQKAARQSSTSSHSHPLPPNLMDAPDDDDDDDLVDNAVIRKYGNDDLAAGSEVTSGKPSESTSMTIGRGETRLAVRTHPGHPPGSNRSDPPAPPRPPNPELLALHNSLHQKFSSSLTTLSQTHESTVARLRSVQTNLLAGEPAIRDEMARLEAIKDVCSSVVRRLSVVVSQTEGRVEEMKRKGEPAVDELVCSSDVVYNQLFDLVAEDNAIEDTIYHLHRALNAGRIDLERFLRTTRSLAEEQFMKRALIEKIVSESQRNTVP